MRYPFPSTSSLALITTSLAWFVLFATPGLAQVSDIASRPLSPDDEGDYSNLAESGSNQRHQQVADSIELTQAATLRSLSWSGRYYTTHDLTSPVAFSVRIFEDAAGIPQTEPIQEFDVAAKAMATGVSYRGFPWQTYSTNIQPLALGPGVYWISIVEADPRTVPGGSTQWLWGDTDSRATGAFRGLDTESWSPNFNNSRHAMTVSEANLVSIDIKPNTATNRVRLGLENDIWVAVISNTAASFDPLQIDVETVRFGPNLAAPQQFHTKDINGDGLGDLFLRFDAESSSIGCFDTNASLSGITHAGVPFYGSDVVLPRNCREVSIDIKPQSSLNRVFPDSEGSLYVAVLSDAVNLFEPDKLDVPTLRFGPGDAVAVGFHTKDLNGDGLGDSVLYFNNLATGIECGDTEATLTGRTLDGEHVSGTDVVSTTDCSVETEDQTPPVITLTGNNPQNIVTGYTYTELGATAIDNVDGNLTASVVIDASAVDTLTPGDYQVTYNVSDAAGNAASTVSRTVTILMQPPSPLPAQATVSVDGSMKTLNFSWSESEYADYYRLLENADGHSGFSQVGNDIPAGTLMVSRNIAVHLFDWVNAQYIIEACNVNGCSSSDAVTATDVMLDTIGYLKASNTHRYDRFGYSVSISTDGHIMAVGAPREDSNAVGVGGNQTSRTRKKSGAVYVFEFDGSNWTQRAYIKASNPDVEDHFGYEVALSGDGRTLVVGVPAERSNAPGINGNQADNSIYRAGAVYVFRDDGTEWYQEAYMKANNPQRLDEFGEYVALSFDGNRLAVAADHTGVSLFEFDGSAWSRRAPVSNPAGSPSSVALSSDGTVLAVGATQSGAVTLYRLGDASSVQWAYIIGSNTEAWDRFGARVALSADGHTLVVSARGEKSSASGIDADQFDNSLNNAGAVYVFRSDGTLWYQEAYIKASNPDYYDQFGKNLALSADGNTLAVGAHSERSSAIGINGDQYDNSGVNNGAVYLFRFDGTNWYQQAYVKAPNTYPRDFFSEGIGLSEHGDTLVIGGFGEDSNATGVGGDLADDSATDAGAVYIY